MLLFYKKSNWDNAIPGQLLEKGEGNLALNSLNVNSQLNI